MTHFDIIQNHKCYGIAEIEWVSLILKDFRRSISWKIYQFHIYSRIYRNDSELILPFLLLLTIPYEDPSIPKLLSKSRSLKDRLNSQKLMDRVKKTFVAFLIFPMTFSSVWSLLREPDNFFFHCIYKYCLLWFRWCSQD